MTKFGRALGATSAVLFNAIGKCMGFVSDAIAAILPISRPIGRSKFHYNSYTDRKSY